MEKKVDELKACVNYFKKNKGFERLFLSIREKYRSLGAMTGTVKILNLKQEEKEALTGFLGTDFLHQKSATIKIFKISEALLKTRYENCSLEMILEGYFNESLETKKEIAFLKEEERKNFFNEVQNHFKNTITENWLKETLAEDGNCCKFLYQVYAQEEVLLKKEILRAGEALNQLPIFEDKTCRLAIFGSKISGDPHYFDEGRLGNKLLTYGLLWLKKDGGNLNLNSEEKAELFYSGGFIKDEVSNLTLTFGLKGILKDQQKHLGLEAFYNIREPLHLSLWNISGIQSLNVENKKVFVFENPTVFSGVLDVLKDKRISLVCTNGQLRLASIILLDLLASSNVLIFYSGDFDPEGLLIADRLKQRYKEGLSLWGFTEEGYKKSCSEKELSEKRLGQLKKIKTEELKILGKKMLKTRKAGYQESLIKDYIKEIQQMIAGD